MNPGSPSLGAYSVYKQQYHILLQQDQLNPEPRSQCIIDLEKFIKERQENQEEIILSIDANETLETQATKNTKINSIQTLQQNTGLTNMAEYTDYTAPTHIGGRQIDFCFISPNLLPAVKNFKYLPFDSITSTDHKLYCIDFDIYSLFDKTPEEAAPLTTRILKTNLPKRKQRYIKSVEQNFKKQNLLEAAKNLQKRAQKNGAWCDELQQAYEAIDCKATNIMLSAEIKSTPKFKAQFSWSLKMRQVGLQQRYYRRLQNLYNGKNIPQSSLERLASLAGIKQVKISP